MYPSAGLSVLGFTGVCVCVMMMMMITFFFAVLCDAHLMRPNAAGCFDVCLL